MKRIVYKVDGIRNGTEKIQMKKALEKVIGVQEIAIDRVDSSIDIQYNPPATEDAITDTIESTGHEIKGESSDDSIVGGLDTNA
ncbi:MAG: heavy-metal-associated domain-containing protein [Vallitaleaceae bacterium]|nr:heavy-metal-associated domain-containing protein [Vallitaleaceae bacterium]